MSKTETNLFISPRSRGEDIRRYMEQSMVVIRLDQLIEQDEPDIPRTRLVRGIADDGANDLHRIHIPMEVKWDPIP